MATIEFDRLDHVGAGVTNLDETAAWWSEHFGFVREADFTIAETGARGAFFRRGDVRLEFFEYPVDGERPTRPTDVVEALRAGGFHHVALQVVDVASAVATLAARGVTIVYPISAGPFGPYAMVEDPSGNFIEIFPETDVRQHRTMQKAVQGTPYMAVRPDAWHRRPADLAQLGEAEQPGSS